MRRPRKSTGPRPASTPGPEPGLTVRRAVPADLDALSRLFDGYRQFYGQPSDPSTGRRFLSERLARNESVVLVAEDRGTAVGLTQLYPSFTSISLGPIFVLNDLFVSPEARHKGVGASLLAAAREHGREQAAHYLELSTAVDNPAQRLYEASGWILDREFLHYELPLTGGLPSP